MLGKRILSISVILVSILAISAFAVVLPFVLFLDASGTVLDDSGSPVSGATVTISTPSPDNTKCFLQGTTTVATDANGHYSLTPRLDIWRADLTCQIDLTISSPGYVGATATTIISATPPQNGQTWTVPGDFVIVSLTNPPLITNVIANPASPTVYVPNQVYTFSADVTDGRGVQEVTFEFDGISYIYTNDTVSNDDLTLVGNTYTMVLHDLPANPSGYTYRWSATDTDSNSVTTSDYNYIITTADAAFSFTINPPSPITYGTPTTATCTVGGTEQTPVITRDGSDVSGENGVAVILPVNTVGYVYQCEVAESENYTAQSSPVITYIVNRANPADPLNPLIHLSLNAVENDQTIVYGASSTALGWTTGGDDGAITTLTR
ncbi:MAG: carboxypeptidase-like regulatory domain-containing protein, partial [Candidatus Aenigmarchaeota archaeon]|nr:carboxypeptidase-like regulatory domain-containing protein [Candidatus Aenigmarchaeota archaeon]